MMRFLGYVNGVIATVCFFAHDPDAVYFISLSCLCFVWAIDDEVRKMTARKDGTP